MAGPVAGAVNQGWVYTDVVKVAGWTLLDYYAHHYPHSTPEQWRTRIERGQILVAGQPALAAHLLQPGQRLTYQREPWVEPTVPLNLETVYEDQELLIVAKPSGLPVLPGGNFLANTLLHLLAARYPESPPIPIHRLGRGTSGLMLLARTEAARGHLSAQMRNGQIQKTYRALASGAVYPDYFTVTTPIGKVPHPQLGYLWAAAPQGLKATSHCQVLTRTPDNSLLEVTIPTGRSHQIRIHLAAWGHPLVGDPLYTQGGLPLANAVPGDLGYWLHSWRLIFRHPVTEEKLTLICPPSVDCLRTEL